MGAQATPGMYGPPCDLARLVAGDREGRIGAAVERLGQRDDFALAGVGLGETERRLDALGAGVGEEGLLKPARADLGQLLGRLGDDRHVVDVRGRVDDLAELVLDRRDHLRVAMAGVVDRDPGEAIDVLRAVDVPELRALRPVDHNRLERATKLVVTYLP